MKKLVLIIAFIAAAITDCFAGITLEECVEKAESNYPLIKQYDLLKATNEIDISDINRDWLPRIGISAQATVQNVVPTFPSAFNGLMEQYGRNIKGMSKFQYKLGVDINQTIWDGGASKSQRDVARAELKAQQANVDTELYAVRDRVETLYFSALLLDRQIEIAESTQTLLKANLSKVNAMIKGGTAMQADADMIEAQILSVGQQITQAREAREECLKMLSIFVGEEIGDKDLVMPSESMPTTLESNRPELKLFDAQKDLYDARSKVLDATLTPKIGFFAQGYYGYPGYNYFESMMNRKPSFNILAGVKISWNIDAFYTRDNSRRKLKLAQETVEVNRNTFLFNTKLQTEDEIKSIEGLRKIISEDERIVKLRGNVRKAAESQLTNGVIDVNALLTKITDENQSKLNKEYHNVQLLQGIQKLRNILNR